ncbi:KilA-N domain-containing protein [Endozoicomonas sp. YOMI1]|uniref:KilA-N domain-containing protein n=1 Tax=Endozoicomonas sp. YOMI1 TaxID=2828739 RepID=UPI0021488BCE|nr:KilA-N domain-containing protein [Endozoicomonas sp. YOMI1]
MKNLTLCGQIVRVNDDGFVSLTDMWKASGEANKTRPKYFLENEQTKAFVEALKCKGGIPPLTIIKGGKTAGTWADKLVAYKYAGWIDPDFEVGTYTVLDKYFSGELTSKDSWQALHDFVIDERCSRKMGAFHGKGLARRRSEKTELQQRHEKLLEEYQHILKLDDL